MVKTLRIQSTARPSMDWADATEMAKARYKHRQETAAKKRVFGFKGANVNRLNNDWWRSPQSADSELRYALRNLRFRCRELERNNDWMRKLLRLFEDNVVSSQGIGLQMKIYDMVKDDQNKEMIRKLDTRSCEIIEQAWRIQCEPQNYTVTRNMSSIEADKLSVRTIVRDGEILTRKTRGFKNKFNYAIQLLEADYLDDFYSDSRTLSNGHQVRMGVEVNDWKEAVAYWLLTQHPGDWNYGWENIAERIRINSDEIIHSYVIERPEQSRGYPWAVAAMNRFNMMGGYEEAELVAARLSACKMGFFENERPNIGEIGGGYQGENDSQWQPMEGAEPGTFDDLPIGKTFKPFDPQHPNSNFPAFSKQQLRAAASSCGVSYNMLASDLEGVNYSSIRAGLLDERETYKGVQKFYIDRNKNLIFEDWLEWVLLGKLIPLKASDYDRLNQKQWKPRRWDWVDPLKDINASVTAIEAGLETRSEVIADRGGDFEDVMTELEYEQEVIEEKGLNFASAQPSTAKPNFPDDQKSEDDSFKGKKNPSKAKLRAMGYEEDEIELLIKSFKKERHNPNHSKQPRHDNGKWKESDIPTLLGIIQNLLNKKSAKPLPELGPLKQAPVPNNGNNSDDWNDAGGIDREWTDAEIKAHAEKILS